MTDTFSTTGDKLRQARIALGLTLEQVEQATRVRTYYLTALEEDDYLSMPSMVQGRGFLRIYADYLGLDPDELLSSWGSSPTETQTSKMPVRETGSEKVIREQPQKAKKHPVKKPPKEKAEQAAVPADEIEPTPDIENIPVEKLPELAPVVPTEQYPAKVGRLDSGGADSSQVIFAEIGKQLSHQRKLLGLSLADVERYTRLRLHYLEALESGNMDGLPSPVQARGMLNNYAHFLNLDSEALLFRYADGLQARRIERVGTLPHRRPATQISKGKLAARRFISFDLVVGSGLIILLVAFIIWGATQVINAQKQAEALPSLPPVSEVLLGTGTEFAHTPGGSETPLETTSQPALTSTIPPTQAAGFSGSLNFTPIAQGNDPIQVYVVARQTAWMRITEDGKMVFQGRAMAGSAYPFSGTTKVEMLTGNAAAFQVFFNQNDMGSLGSEGQVIDLVFGKDGLIVPTATITPTPTNTPAVTATPSVTTTATTSPTSALPAINTPNPSLAPATP